MLVVLLNVCVHREQVTLMSAIDPRIRLSMPEHVPARRGNGIPNASKVPSVPSEGEQWSILLEVTRLRKKTRRIDA